eukprot:5959409-Lingulodinium_polyedra.AAC.1
MPRKRPRRVQGPCGNRVPPDQLLCRLAQRLECRLPRPHHPVAHSAMHPVDCGRAQALAQ